MNGISNVGLRQNEDLSISINDKTSIIYNGTEAKTLNIKLSDLGASAIGHTHEYLPLTGGIMTAGTTVKYIADNGEVRISSNVAGNRWDGNTGAGDIVTGIIKIELPVKYTNTMMMLELMIYNYLSNTSTIMSIAGYNFLDSGRWYNPTVILDNSKLISNVRFGDDGTHCCILIYSITGKWVYPSVTITKLMTSHKNIDMFRTEIKISMILNDTGFNDTLVGGSGLIIQKPNY